MHSIAGIIDDPVLLELAIPMHTRASSKLALQSLASLFILPAVILLRFVCLFTANWYSNQSTFRILKAGNSPVRPKRSYYTVVVGRCGLSPVIIVVGFTVILLRTSKDVSSVREKGVVGGGTGRLVPSSEHFGPADVVTLSSCPRSRLYRLGS